MFVVVLTVYFICTYLSEFIEPLLQLLYIPTFGPFFSKFGNLEIFIFVILYVFFFFIFTYPGLCIGEDTQGCCVPSQLVKYFMPNVSRRLIRINVRQVHLDPSVGYDFVRMLSLLMI